MDRRKHVIERADMPEIQGEVYKAATISGWGMAVPPAVRYNRFFLPFTPYNTVSEILARCGVQQRRVLSEGETTAGLATLAAERALENCRGADQQCGLHHLCQYDPTKLGVPGGSLCAGETGCQDGGSS